MQLSGSSALNVLMRVCACDMCTCDCACVYITNKNFLDI